LEKGDSPLFTTAFNQAGPSMFGQPRSSFSPQGSQGFSQDQVEERHSNIGSSTGPAYATPIYNKEKEAAAECDDNLDEFDDLTIEELRSLLDNFKNLSKGEQMDLIRYMKKLEQNDPEKVKLLKQSVKSTKATRTSYA